MSMQRIIANFIADEIANGVDAYYDRKTCVTCGVRVEDTCPIGAVRKGESVPCEPERNLREDMRICGEATGGPWVLARDTRGNEVGVITEGRYYDIAVADTSVNARFIAEARTGWPHAIKAAQDAIERAMAAEKRVAELERKLAYIRDSCRDSSEFDRKEAAEHERYTNWWALHTGRAEMAEAVVEIIEERADKLG